MSAGAVKERLLRELWDRDERYYDLAREQVHTAAMAGGEYAFLRRWLPVRGTVLEVGCGEGSNLDVIRRAGLRFVGCDLSALGLARAQAAARAHAAAQAAQAEAARRHTAAAAQDNAGRTCAPAQDDAAQAAPPEFLRADGERLPFPDRHFDAAFAVSLLEHLPEPGAVIEEMIRVLAPGGKLVLISPQYGGPLGASPCRKSGGAGRFLRRLVRAHLPWSGSGGAVDRRVEGKTSAGPPIGDIAAGAGSAAPASRRSSLPASSARASLDWDRVTPLVLEGAIYDGDLDAVIEPELSSLRRFLRARGVTIEAATSGFEWYTWLDRRASLPQLAARALLEPLGRAGIRPYRDFGPLLAVAGYKDFRA